MTARKPKPYVGTLIGIVVEDRSSPARALTKHIVVSSAFAAASRVIDVASEATDTRIPTAFGSEDGRWVSINAQDLSDRTLFAVYIHDHSHEPWYREVVGVSEMTPTEGIGDVIRGMLHELSLANRPSTSWRPDVGA